MRIRLFELLDKRSVRELMNLKAFHEWIKTL